MQPSLKLQRGVTWVELLLVIAVLMVLAAIFFPVFAHVHTRDGHWSCRSNMKQIGLALIQYAQDNDNELPPGAQPTPGLGWAGQIYPYAKSVELFQCPDDIAVNQTPTLGVMSYAYNSNIPRWFSRQKRPTNGVPNPAVTVLLFEVAGDMIQTPVETNYPSAHSIASDEGAAQGATTFSAAGDGTASGLHSVMRGADPIRYATGDIGGRPGGAINQFNEARHQGGSNFLLADCHAKWFKPERISTGSDAPNSAAAQTGGMSGTAAGTANPNYAVTFSVK